MEGFNLLDGCAVEILCLAFFLIIEAIVLRTGFYKEYRKKCRERE